MKQPAVVFIDVYETMLNMEDVERKVNSIMDSKRGYVIWTELFMQYCFIENCLHRFNDFLDIGKATMQMAGKILGRNVSDTQAQSALELLKHVPLHEDVHEGLSQMRDMGVRLAALTNASSGIVKERMERTGLVSYFEQLLTSDMIHKYKPCTEVYQWALDAMDVAASEAMMVTSHGWDIAGASNAGLQTAYIQRSQEGLYELAPSPSIQCRNFTELLAEMQAPV